MQRCCYHLPLLNTVFSLLPVKNGCLISSINTATPQNKIKQLKCFLQHFKMRESITLSEKGKESEPKVYTYIYVHTQIHTQVKSLNNII